MENLPWQDYRDLRHLVWGDVWNHVRRDLQNFLLDQLCANKTMTKATRTLALDKLTSLLYDSIEQQMLSLNDHIKEKYDEPGLEDECKRYITIEAIRKHRGFF